MNNFFGFQFFQHLQAFGSITISFDFKTLTKFGITNIFFEYFGKFFSKNNKSLLLVTIYLLENLRLNSVKSLYNNTFSFDLF